MNLKPQRTLLLITLAAFLAACNLAPPVSQLITSGTSQNEQVTLLDGIQRKTILPATYQQQVQQKQQTITFPNMVTTSELAEPPTEDISEVEAELKAEGIDLDALDAEGFSTQSSNKRLHFAQFLTQLPRKPRPYQVKVSANGQFKLTLQEGAEYAVLDNDATDGQAKIQLPAGTLKTWLHLDKNWRKNSELQVEDSLYYVNDTLSSAKKKWFDRHRWLKLGLRPMPVPSDWHSDDGNTFVLNFTAKDVSGFDMVWLNKKNKQAAFPPGIKEIGPEGGIVELPGVAKLDLPNGALSEPTLVRLIQELVVPDIQEDCRYGRVCRTGDKYISSVVRIEPINLKLQAPADLSLAVSDKYKNFPDNWGSFFGIISFDNLSSADDYNISGYSRTKFVYEPIPILTFSYFGIVISIDAVLGHSVEANKFSLMQVSDETTSFASASEHFIVENHPDFNKDLSSSDRVTQEEVDWISNVLEKTYQFYSDNGFLPPTKVDANTGKALVAYYPQNPGSNSVGSFRYDRCEKGVKKISKTGRSSQEIIKDCTPILFLFKCSTAPTSNEGPLPGEATDLLQCNLKNSAAISTFAHEVFHYFQMGDVQHPDEYIVNRESTDFDQNQWFFESSAEWAGLWFNKENAGDFGIDNSGNTNFDVYKMDELFTLFVSLQNLHQSGKNPSSVKSFKRNKNSEDLEEYLGRDIFKANPYIRASFFAHIQKNQPDGLTQSLRLSI